MRLPCELAAIRKHLRKPIVIPQPWIPYLRRVKARWALFDNRREAEPGYPFISEKGPAASDRHSLGQRGGWRTGVFPTVGKPPGTTLSLLPSPRHV